MSNLRFLSQTRSHFDHSRDKKSDRDPPLDHSSHLFCSPRHLCVSCHNAYRPSFFLVPFDLRGLSLLAPSPFAPFAPSPFAPFAPSPCILSPFCLSPPPFCLSPPPFSLSLSFSLRARSSRLTHSSSFHLVRLISSSAFLAVSTSFQVLAAPEYDFSFSVGFAPVILEL